MIEVIGHRGFAARAPENTLVSIDLALAAGADAVEWDVRTAACGTPVLFHDANLGRTSNGVGPVRRRTFAQLRKLDAGSWFSDEFRGEPIPSLRQALEAVRERGVPVYCEVKGYRELEDLDRMVEIVRSLEMADRVIFISLDFRIVERVAGRGPDTRIAYVVKDADRVQEAVGRVERHGRGMVDVDRRLLLADPEQAALVVRAGVPLGAWTVNVPEEADRLAAMGVRYVTTDEVERILDWRAARR